MSAVAGMVDWRGAPAGSAVKAALAALELHGRDGQGFWDGGDVALGWRQTILHEEDYADGQPLTGGGKRFKLVFDGRLDNREELARLLRLDAEQTRQWPDSRYVLAGFEKWSEDCPARLLGDFAFALWDCERRALLLGRDILGIRPLVYRRTEAGVFFASMPSALFSDPGIPRAIDEDTLLREICMRRLRPAQTFYQGILRVPVGHVLRFTAEGCSARRYWNLADAKPVRCRSDDAYVEAFRTVFGEAVKCRLRTVHPIGSHLSGGFDSSSVTATAAALLAADGRRLSAFTHVPPAGWKPAVELPGALSDEGPLASLVAGRFANIDHILVPAPGRWGFEGLDYYARHFERPRWDANNAGWFDDLHRYARARGIRVMITGGAGNLTISSTGEERIAELIRRASFVSLCRECVGLMKGGRSARSVLAVVLSSLLPMELWHRVLELAGRPSTRSNILNCANRRLALPLYREYLRTPALNPDPRQATLEAFVTHDWDRVFCGSLSAWDMDFRDPTGDRRVVEFIYGIPTDQLLRDGKPKWLLKRAMRGALPDALLAEKKRGRQASDWHETAYRSKVLFQQELRELSGYPAAARLLDLALMERLVSQWDPRRLARDPALYRKYSRLIHAFALGRFARRFETINGNSSKPEEADDAQTA